MILVNIYIGKKIIRTCISVIMKTKTQQQQFMQKIYKLRENKYNTGFNIHENWYNWLLKLLQFLKPKNNFATVKGKLNLLMVVRF